MVTAFVLINVTRGKLNEVAQQLLQLKGIAEVFSIAGQYDAIAVLRTATNEDIADLVTDHMLTIPNIVKTETMLAFRAFSREDMGAMFSIGSEA